MTTIITDSPFHERDRIAVEEGTFLENPYQSPARGHRRPANFLSKRPQDAMPSISPEKLQEMNDMLDLLPLAIASPAHFFRDENDRQWEDIHPLPDSLFINKV
jgi:hypothetical protein